MIILKKIVLVFNVLIFLLLVGCDKKTTTINPGVTDLVTTSISTTTTEEVETTNEYCYCGYYQQRPFEISLSLTQIIDELESRGYYFVNYTEEYYAYFPEDLLAIEQRDLEWYNATVRYEEIITAYFDTDYGQLQIDIFQFENSNMASDLAHGYFQTENCFSAVVIYANDVIVRMFWYFESLLFEWSVNPICEGVN